VERIQEGHAQLACRQANVLFETEERKKGDKVTDEKSVLSLSLSLSLSALLIAIMIGPHHTQHNRCLSTPFLHHFAHGQ